MVYYGNSFPQTKTVARGPQSVIFVPSIRNLRPHELPWAFFYVVMLIIQSIHYSIMTGVFWETTEAEILLLYIIIIIYNNKISASVVSQNTPVIIE